MADLLVPVIDSKLKDVVLHKISCSVSNFGLVIYDDENNIVLSDLFESKINSFFDEKPSVEIHFEDIEKQQSCIQFCESTQSITLGLFLELYREIHNFSYRNKYDYIVVTGDIKEKKLDAVSDLQEKFEAVKRLHEQDSSKSILFLYVGDKEIKTSGYQKKLNVIKLNSQIPFLAACSEVFTCLYDDEVFNKLKSISLRGLDHYIETADYKILKNQILKNSSRGFLLIGQSNSGKSCIAYNLVHYLINLQEADDFIWLSLKDGDLYNFFYKNEDASFNNKKGNFNKKDELINFFEQQIKLQLDLNKRQILIIDNLELDIVDDILEAISVIKNRYNNISYLFVTSWKDTKNNIICDKLNIQQYKLKGTSEEDVSELFDLLLDTDFKSNYSTLSLEESIELKKTLYEIFKNNIGGIQLALNSLKTITVAELLKHLNDSNTEFFSKQVYFYNLNFAQLGLFSQIVLYAYLSLYCDFNDEQFTIESIQISDIQKRIKESELLSAKLITEEAITKALKQIENHYLFENIGNNKYTIKKDVLRFFLFHIEDSDIEKQIISEFVNNSLKINTAVLYDCVQEFKDLVTNTNFDVFDRQEALIEICKSKNSKIEYLKILKELNVDFNKEDKRGETVIHHAVCENPSLEFIKYLINECDIDFTRISNRTGNILHYATLNDNPDILKYLLSLIIDVNSPDIDLWTPLHVASLYASNVKIIELLVENGALLTSKTRYEELPIHFAVKSSNVEIINYFINCKKFNKIKEVKDIDENTPLLTAASLSSNVEIIKALINAKCNINATDIYGENIFHKIARNKSLEINKYFFDNFDFKLFNTIDYEFFLPLTNAIAHNTNLDVIKLYYTKGLDFSIKDGNNAGLLHIAAKFNPNIEIFKFILSLGLEDISNLDSQGNTIAHYAAEMNKNEQIIRELQILKCDFCKKNENGQTALMLATKNSNINILKKIINYHLYSDINEIDDDGYSAIHYACMYGTPESVQVLIQAGADIQQLDNYKKNALMFCAENENLEVLKFLIDKSLFSKEDINLYDEFGRTALVFAVGKNKNIELIDYLLDHGASIDVMDKYRRTLLHHLTRYNTNLDIFKYLFSRGIFGRYSIDIPDNKGYTPLSNAIRFNENLDIIKYLVEERHANTLLKQDTFEFTYLQCATLNPNLDVLRYVLANKSKFFSDINECDSYRTNVLSTAAKYAKNIEIFQLLHHAGGIPVINDNGNNILHMVLYSIENQTAEEYRLAEEKINYILNNNLCSINEINNDGESFFHQSLKYSFSSKLFSRLIDLADIYLKTRDGKSFQFLACRYGSLDLINLLIDKGLLTTEILNEKGTYWINPFMGALAYNTNKNVIERILTLNPEFSSLSIYGDTILHLVIQNKNIEIVTLLLDKFSNININDTNDYGETLFHQLCRFNINPKIISVLKKYKVDESLRDDFGYTFFHSAAENKNVEIIKTLIEYGLVQDINVKNNYGQTALFLAAEQNNFEVFEYLIKLGLSPSDVDFNGKTPLDLIDSDYRSKYSELVKNLII